MCLFDIYYFNIENFQIDFEVPEFLQAICPYVKKLYISGTERNIIIYENRNNTDKHKDNGILLLKSDLVKYYQEVVTIGLDYQKPYHKPCIKI